MKIQNLIRWSGIVTGALYGLIVTGFGIYLAVQAQDCLSYNDYDCAFGGMFSFAIIPFGLVVLLSIGLAALPFKLTQLLGGIFSLLTGLLIFGVFCLMSSYIFIPDSESLIWGDMLPYLLTVLLQLVGAFALFAAGITGILQMRQHPAGNRQATETD